MTSKLTREQLHERARENVKALKMASRQTAFESAREEILADLQLAELALAAMDSEPVAWTWHYREQWHVTRDKGRAAFVATDGDVAVLPLYRHAQPVPVVSTDLLHAAASAIEDLLTTKDRAGAGVWFDLPFRLRSAANAQPAPVVPDERDKTVDADDHPLLWSFNEGWNACRAAMLAVAPQPQNAPQNIPEIIPGGLVEAVNNLLNNDGSRGCYDAMECNAARVEIELWLAQRQRQREQRKTNLSAGISPVIPEGWQVEAEKLAEIYGMSFVLFRHGEVPQCADPTKVVISFTDKGLGHDTLPAAHQEVKGE